MRYLGVLGLQRLFGASPVLPWGTLAVNVLGSFAAGALVAWLSADASSNSIARPFLLVGVLGGFTTFSAFSVETLALLQAGRIATAIGYALASVIACVLGASVGFKCLT